MVRARREVEHAVGGGAAAAPDTDEGGEVVRGDVHVDEAEQDGEHFAHYLRTIPGVLRSLTVAISLLPDELVDWICTHLPDHVKVTLFALTFHQHWQIGRHHIRSRIKELCNWAGDRLICLGSCTGDLPPGLLTAAEEKELETGYTSADELIDESDDDDDDYDKDGEIHEDGGSREDNAKTTRISLYEVARRRFTEQVNTDFRNDWDLLELRDRNHGHEDKWAVSNIMLFGFGEVLGLRSFWSETEQGSEYDWDYCHGVWAGHWFDIVLEQDHEKAMERKEWTDVSKKVLAEMVKSEGAMTMFYFFIGCEQSGTNFTLTFIVVTMSTGLNP
ncbi:hypothetical protein HETIRDRAFT_446209 [Heterobasidion irregulare TC 32-1]|uniref:Uncharacterized protein n=1 Tax=Heterobasidion irregulare (strain TC 32-1) TaxID=747525 RepID=W4JVW3_HETIT|nr:uncharacterized protein HETIRDRAFT_446209 [Heterobasidion irregulare TC 32-1]ETW77011.1 hypothetical protein HETIRDRAFT_446209 [Heterobasidion irregulare TC 32-1]